MPVRLFLDLASQSSLSLHSSGADDDDTSLIRDPITNLLQSLCGELVVGQLMLYDDLNTLRTFKFKFKGDLKESFNAGGEDGSYSSAQLNPTNIESFNLGVIESEDRLSEDAQYFK